MIEKLTAEQKKLKNTVKEEWIQAVMSCPELNEQKARAWVKYLYCEIAKRPEPRIIIAKDPIDTQRIARKLMNREKFIPFCWYGNIWDYPWLAYYDFFRRIGVGKEKKLKIDQYMQLRETGIFTTIQLSDTVIICPPPIFINKDERKRLHCTTGPAIVWKDGWGLYRVHKVKFTKEEFDRLFLTKPSPEEILSVQNSEQKAVLIDHYGYDYITDNLKKKETIDQCVEYLDENKKKPVKYELFSYDFSAGIRQTCLKVEWYEKTGERRSTLLGVPSDMRTCKQARAWTWGLEKLEISKES